MPIGAHNDGVGWHTDYSYKAEPVMCTMLYAVEVPPEGSDTLLADGCAAWNALPAGTPGGARGPEAAPQLSALHGDPRSTARGSCPRRSSATIPDVIHPLVRTHPADGRKALWPSTGTVIEVVGMPNPAGLWSWWTSWWSS